MDEYLTHLVEGYFYLKENYKFVEDAFEKASKKNEEYVKRISLLESQLTDIGVSPEISPELELDHDLGSTVEPSSGVAVNEIVMKCNSAIATMKCDDNQTNLPLNLQEVIEQS